MKNSHSPSLFTRLYTIHPAFFAISLVVVGYLGFNIIDSFNKLLTDHYAALEIMTWTNLSSTITLLIFAGFHNFKDTFRSDNWRWHIGRGLLFFVYVYLCLVAVTYLSLANFYAILFFSPIICVVLGRIFFKDALSPKKALAVILGFMGVLIVVQPSNIPFNIGSMACLAAVILYSVSLMFIRKIGNEYPKLLFGISSCFIICLCAFVTTLITDQFRIPAIDDLLLMIVIGVMIGFASTSISAGFQIAPSTSTVASFHYIQIVGGIVIGYFVWGDIPSWMSITGSVIIIMSGIWIIFLERNQNSALYESHKDIHSGVRDGASVALLRFLKLKK